MAAQGAEDEPQSLLDRAIGWTGNVNDLVDIYEELAIDWDHAVDDHDEYFVREVCITLLNHAGLPELYRAQLSVFMATTEDEHNLSAMHAWLEEAETAIAVANCPMRHSHSCYCDDQVENLSASIQRMIVHVEQAVRPMPPLPRASSPFPMESDEAGLGDDSTAAGSTFRNEEEASLSRGESTLDMDDTMTAETISSKPSIRKTKIVDNDITATIIGEEPAKFECEHADAHHSQAGDAVQKTEIKLNDQEQVSAGLVIRRRKEPASIRMKEGNLNFPAPGDAFFQRKLS